MEQYTEYPDSYVEYLALFHGSRDYFECHEVMEEYWKEQGDTAYKPIWHGLIQVAVALYHQRRGNQRGAEKMMASALNNLRGQPVSELGMDGSTLLETLARRLEAINAQAPYEPLHLPLSDPRLSATIAELTGGGDSRYAPEDENAPAIRDKHLVRDRSEVVAQRLAAWERRRRS